MQHLKENFLLELAILLGLALVYIVLRWIVFRRSITYKEFENISLAVIVISILALFIITIWR